MIFTLRSGGTAHPETSVLQNITDLIASSGVLEVTGTLFKVEAQAVPDMTVKVKVGRAYIKGALTNNYPVRSDVDENVTISPNSSGNPRIDTVVLYIDLSVAPNTDASNVAKLAVVQGTPAASPSAPTTSEIQTAIGSANPFITLANISVSSGATSITNSNITDTRVKAIFTIGGGGSTSFINNETPVGVIDGVNLVFTAAFPYVGGSLMVFRDGQLMVPSASADYQETNPATGVFTFITAPATGSVIRISYQKVVSTTGNADTVDGFHANSTPTPNQLLALDNSGMFPASAIPGLPWTLISGTLTFLSSSNPVFVATTSADLTGTISPGMRIRLVQTTTKYFIVVAISATTITLYGGTDYALVNSAISSVNYATDKAPYGFPLSPAKWTVSLVDGADRTQASPVANTWYNIGSLSISIPIGSWHVSFQATGQWSRPASTFGSMWFALSTLNSGVSDNQLLSLWGVSGASGTVGSAFRAYQTRELDLIAATTYFLIERTTDAGETSIDVSGSSYGNTIIKAVCAYL